MEPPASGEALSREQKPPPEHIGRQEFPRLACIYLIRSIGGASATLLMWALCDASGYSIALVPFITSIVMIFGSPDSPQARARNVVGGHIIASAVTLASVSLLGYEPWVAIVAVGTGMWLMLITDTFHPPSGMSILVIITTHADWSYLAVPVTVGAILLTAYSTIYFEVFRRCLGAQPAV